MKRDEAIRRARRLRLQMTDAERKLWRHLRNSRVAGHKFRRQHPVAGYIVDFVCMRMRLIVELDGGQHLEQAAYDETRRQKLQHAGFEIIRFWNDDALLRTDIVLQAIHNAIAPPPSPPPSRSP